MRLVHAQHSVICNLLLGMLGTYGSGSCVVYFAHQVAVHSAISGAILVGEIQVRDVGVLREIIDGHSKSRPVKVDPELPVGLLDDMEMTKFEMTLQQLQYDVKCAEVGTLHCAKEHLPPPQVPQKSASESSSIINKKGETPDIHPSTFQVYFRKLYDHSLRTEQRKREWLMDCVKHNKDLQEEKQKGGIGTQKVLLPHFTSILSLQMFLHN